MPKTLRRSSLFCGSLGIAVGVVVVHTLAFTATFSAPRGIFLDFRSRAAFEIGLFLWDAMVVYGLGAGVITFGALLAAYGSFAVPTARSTLLIWPASRSRSMCSYRSPKTCPYRWRCHASGGLTAWNCRW